MDTKDQKNIVVAALFGNNPAVSLDERARVMAELEKIGSLTFGINKDENGWIAQCDEVPGIIAGGTNPNPSPNEIESEIRSAIFAAFNVRETEPEARSPYFGIRDFSNGVSMRHVGG
jgi:predicted RNase H-like HicB family nuclease